VDQHSEGFSQYRCGSRAIGHAIQHFKARIPHRMRPERMDAARNCLAVGIDAGPTGQEESSQQWVEGYPAILGDDGETGIAYRLRDVCSRLAQYDFGDR